MLTFDQIDALGNAAEKITAPITEYLIRDLARRVSQAGQLTSTAAYQIWTAQQLGVSQREVKRKLRRLLALSQQEIERVFYQSAQSGYSLDVRRFPHVQAVPFEQNAALQQIVSAAVELAGENFTNLTQTLGMVDPRGNALPLQSAYRACTDFAFKQVITGAASYTEAVRQAARNLAGQGVRVIDYESGVHTGLEAAVRRNMLGGLGLMQEQISQTVHDQLGCDGWEITAHANSAPDHEPIQGKQYADAAYQALNNSLRRRIGTLNCGHAAFPIILGANRPQYTAGELEKFRADNEKGGTVEGRHYTGYEATQMQRKLERAIRRQKLRVMTDEATGDKEKLAADRTKLTLLRQRYREFSKAAGLRTQEERTEVAGFGTSAAKSVANPTNSGIMEQNRPEEIPEMTETPAAVPEAPAKIMSGDVTEEYLRSATPAQGTVICEDGYKVKVHQSEISMANWLYRTFGGDIKLLNESKEPGDKTPDFLWNGRYWELKGVTTKNSVDRAVREAAKQIQAYPGGVILDVTASDLSIEEIEDTIGQRVKRIALDSVDVLIISRKSLKKILRYKK